MSELREAAERVCGGFEYGTRPSSLAIGRMCNDARLIAEQWLAEHPADTELEITEDWLESLGCTHADSWYFKVPGKTNMQAEVQLVRWSGGYSVRAQDRYTSVLIANVKTRGDLRDLAKALGIVLEGK